MKPKQTPKEKAIEHIMTNKLSGKLIKGIVPVINQALDIAISEAEKQGYEKGKVGALNQVLYLAKSGSFKTEAEATKCFMNMVENSLANTGSNHLIEQARQEGYEKRKREEREGAINCCDEHYEDGCKDGKKEGAEQKAKELKKEKQEHLDDLEVISPKLNWIWIGVRIRQLKEELGSSNVTMLNSMLQRARQEGADQKARLIYNDVFENFRNTDGTYMILEFIEQKHLKEVKKEDLSLCPRCNCMAKTIQFGVCEKCKEKKFRKKQDIEFITYNKTAFYEILKILDMNTKGLKCSFCGKKITKKNCNIIHKDYLCCKDMFCVIQFFNKIEKVKK